MINSTYRTPGVEAVLAGVRTTGWSAHPKPGQTVSILVALVAIDLDLNPVELQAEVETYANAMDKA